MKCVLYIGQNDVTQTRYNNFGRHTDGMDGLQTVTAKTSRKKPCTTCLLSFLAGSSYLNLKCIFGNFENLF